MTLIRVTLALMLMMAVVLLAAGCAGNVADEIPAKNGSPPLTMTVPVSSETIHAKITSNAEMVIALRMYRNNLTYPRNKIPENILQVTDPVFPSYLNSTETAKAQRIASRHLIPSHQVIERFNLQNNTERSIGDQVFLTIYVYPNTTTHILDPFITNVSNRKEGFHGVEAWVDVNNLEKMAALDGVRGMQFVVALTTP
jgi:hypothetical protein